MALEFDIKEAKRLIKEHKQILAQLGNASKQYDSLCIAVENAVKNVIKDETKSILSNTDVEELNRDKRGFRVKLLRDNGYKTIADISKTATVTLSEINGISSESAIEIKKCADEFYKTAEQSVKIKLNVDNKTSAYTDLIKSVSKYVAYSPYADNCSKLYTENYKTVNTAVTQLEAVSNTFKWMFSSAKKKQTAYSAFETLSLMRSGDYYKQACESLNLLNSIKYRNTDVWQEFSNEPVKFFNAIEEICPDVLGTNDNMYGLPEELAISVSEQVLKLDGLKCKLRKYQEWGVKYALKQGRVLLGDEMGLGKTIQAIATMVSLRNSGATHFVVVCPASVISNWCREISKMSDLTAIKIHGADKTEAFNRWVNDGSVAVTTFETTGLFQFHDGFKYDMLVVDEAHYIKNPKAQRTNNVKNICDNAKNILFMTGTALENKVEEMISLIQILKPEVASSVKGMEFLSSAQQFRENVAPVYYRRKREDVLTELPDLIESEEWCTLEETEQQKYEKSILDGNFADIRRVSWNVDDINNSSKAKRMLEIIEEAENDNRKVIVFSFFLDTVNKVMQLLGDKCIGPINGSVSPQKRQELVDEFNNAPAGSVLVSQIQSGGTGLNIQSASVVVLCEPQFKPSIENQAISRAYRMGQTRNVLVYRLLADDTADERIIEILNNKQAVFDAFADESVAADESFELDDNSFGNIVKAEVQRINDKNSDKL